jgi:hypothetical protein
MPVPLADVNVFGPIGGKDYLKQTAAARFKARLKGNIMTTAMANAANSQLQPSQVLKNAWQMYLQNTHNEVQAGRETTGNSSFPVGGTADGALKSAVEKLAFGCTSFENGRGKTAVFPAILGRALPAAWRIGKGAYGLARGAAGALRGGTGAAQAFSKADTIGSGISGAAKAVGSTAQRGAQAYSPASAEAYRTIGRIGEEAGKLKGTSVGGRLWGGLQGSSLGYGVDAGAGMAGIDTDGWGTTLGGIGGLMGAGPLRMLRRGIAGKNPNLNAGLGTTTTRQKLLNTGDNIASSVADFGRTHAGKLHTAAGLGGLGMVQRATTGGLYDMTDLQGNISRAQDFAKDNLSQGLGYDNYDMMREDVSPIVNDLRQLLQQQQQSQRRY